jgi:hypothetical protein
MFSAHIKFQLCSTGAMLLRYRETTIYLEHKTCRGEKLMHCNGYVMCTFHNWSSRSQQINTGPYTRQFNQSQILYIQNNCNIIHTSMKIFTSWIKWQGCCVDHEMPCSAKVNWTSNECINVTMRHVHITIVSVEKQSVLHILSVSVALVNQHAML